MAFTTAGDVALLDPLKDPLAAIKRKRQSALDAELGKISSQATESMRGRGVSRSDYIPQEISRAGGMASRGIEDTLLGALGGASYDELQKKQEHDRNLALAREIGSLSAPSLLEQILGGLGGAAGAGAQFGSLFSALGKKKKGLEYGGGSGELPDSLSLFPGFGASGGY